MFYSWTCLGGLRERRNTRGDGPGTGQSEGTQSLEWSLSGQCGDSLDRQDTGGERLLHCELPTCHLSWARAPRNTLYCVFAFQSLFPNQLTAVL